MKGISTILGGLPIYAIISCGYDSYNMEYWAEVESIHWLKKDKTPGKEISQKLYDKAEKYDPYFSNLIENISNQLAYERHQEMFQLS